MKQITMKRNGLALLPCMLAGILAVAVCALAFALTGCSGAEQSGGSGSESQAGGPAGTVATAAGASGSDSADGKTFVYGTTGYGTQMEDDGLDPHDGYSGWSTVRYGVGETLFKFSDAMEPKPWLATGYTFTDKTHCVITIRRGVTFTSGRKLTGQAVKECLDDLVKRNDRAALDMKIKRISAEGQRVTIETKEPCPALINYLCDPYGTIIDMKAGITDDENVSGTGPYRATAVSPTEITLVPNKKYWDGTPKLGKIIVRSISDGDTLTNALQSGEINAAYGMPYASYQLFGDTGQYTIRSCDTSRAFFAQANYHSKIMRDKAVRQAIAYGIDKSGFVNTLLDGRGQVAKGPFPATMKFGDKTVKAAGYDPEKAKAILDKAGWKDTDGDGIREKDGQKLTLRWLTYPGRMELPLLAQSAQSTLGDIGFDVQVNSTADHAQTRQNRDAWDVYASALVCAPTGDPEYFFGTHAIKGSSANYGGYENAKVQRLYDQLHREFDPAKRAALGTQLTQVVLDDNAMVFASHLTMGIVAQSTVTGLKPHPCDYYEITADLDMK